MKIRQLVSPVFQHSFPPFRAWTEREAAAQFPLETENMTSRLGLVGTIGFLGLLGLLFVPNRRAGRSGDGKLLLGAGQLTLAVVLLATVGGFGSLFSLLISPEIRAYNRIDPVHCVLCARRCRPRDRFDLVKTPARRRPRPWSCSRLALADQRIGRRGIERCIRRQSPQKCRSLEAFVRAAGSRSA